MKNNKNTGWIITGVSVLMIWLILLLFYNAKVKKLNISIKKAKQEIEQINQARLKANELRKTAETSKELYKLFPVKEEDGLKIIFNYAKMRNAEIVSVEPQTRETFKDSASQEITNQGKTCKTILVALKLKSTYADLIEYIKSLNIALSGFVTVERLEIKQKSDRGVKKHIEMDVKLYILS